MVVADVIDDATKQAATEVDSLEVQLDVSDRASVDAAVCLVEQQLGTIDVLVNNAGWDDFRPFLETEETFWDRVIETNFKGCMRVSHRVMPRMVQRERGPRDADARPDR